MNDRKFNTNDQQARGLASELANSNAPVGTPTELILAEAEKYRSYITEGLVEGTPLGETVTRVMEMKAMRHAQEMEKENRRMARIQKELDEDPEYAGDDEAGEDEKAAMTAEEERAASIEQARADGHPSALSLVENASDEEPQEALEGVGRNAEIVKIEEDGRNAEIAKSEED